MTTNDPARSIRALFESAAVHPLARFFAGLHRSDRHALYGMLATAVVLGFLIGRRGTLRSGPRRAFGISRFTAFQNSGEAQVSRILLSHFSHPNYHLMNHVTIQMEDGTTQIDHILVSRFGIFVIETKDYNGWIFANPNYASWTQVFFHRKFRFQNPLCQNRRHVRALRELLSSLSPNAVKPIVVFTGGAEFKTGMPVGVLTIGQLAEYLRRETEACMSLDQLHRCVGRLETARLAISRETDVQHVQSLARRRGTAD